MGRIRSIKPEFPHSESMGRVSREARLLFILLWTLADDSGRLRGTSRMLASLLYPYDNDAAKHIDGWLADLEREGCVIRYVVDGTSYAQVCNWGKHQKIDRPSPSKIPALAEPSTKPREESRTLVVGLDLDLEGIGSGPGPVPAPRATALGSSNKPPKLVEVAKPAGLSDALWNEWRAVRGKKLVTQLALDAITREAAKAGLTLDEAVALAAENGWQSFKADYIKTGSRGAPKRRSINDDICRPGFSNGADSVQEF